ncbi:MAG: hypothetical protein LBF77_05645 [Spirochaetaceae bacterium]|jgi:hypothetical protein|nr:hypothetical protein [Spirochaetaceae bacterium]
MGAYWGYETKAAHRDTGFHVIGYDGEFNEYVPGCPDGEARSAFAEALLEGYARAGRGVFSVACPEEI